MVDPRYVKKRIDMIVELIEGLDSFRAGSPRRSISKLEKLYVSLKLKNAPYKWKVLSHDMKGILDIPKYHPSYERFIKVHQAASILSYISLGALILGFFFALRKDALPFFYTFTATIMLTNISLTLRIYETRILSQIFKDKEDILEGKGERIKETINYLLILLKRELRKLRQREKIVKLNLYRTDYVHIQILKKPSPFRSTYLVKIQ